MGAILLITRLFLALVFIVAGLAKLADLAGSRQALRDFGAPAALARPFGVLLPLAELAVAVALLPPASAWWGSLGALALLLVFVVGIGYNLARGRTPDCHCFGQLHSAPAGWPTLIRNLILAALAGLVVGLGPQYPAPNVLGWFGALALAQRIELLVGVVVVALLAVESWVLLKVLSQQGRLLLRLEAIEARLAANGMTPQAAPTGNAALPVTGLPVGAPAPAFALSTLTGETITLDALRALGKPVVLIFSDPNCGPCTALLPEIGRWQSEYATKLVVALMSRGDPEANRARAAEHGITHLLLQQDREVAEAYQAYGTPSTVLVHRNGTIGSPVAPGADAIRGLIASAMNPAVLSALPMAIPGNGNGRGAAPASSSPAGLQVGEPAPELRLPDLKGKLVDLADFRGSPTLVLFWNPGCGFCQRMLEDLKAWEARPPSGAPKLLVVSTGTVEANEAMGLHSPVLLDEGFHAGSTFGANGTPMAVLVDDEGKIASEVAAGAQAVLALAGHQQDTTVPA